MRALRVFSEWTRAGGQLGFYTKFTKDQIPAVEGCYAWFLPLWIYSDDLQNFLNTVNAVFRYEPDPKERTTRATFNWGSIELGVRRDIQPRATDAKERTWKRLLNDPKTRSALERVMLEASLLTPPLYVGKTTNLRRRYMQHTESRSGQFNDFHRRFADCVRGTCLHLSVSDLLFVCIKTSEPIVDGAEDQEGEIDALLEQILMQICMPPFSLR